MINICWCCLKWGLPLVLIAAAATAAYVYHRVDEEIRLCVQQRIAEHYAGLKVTVRSAELVEGKGIEVRGLSILEPGAEGPRAELIYCDEVFLSCTAELADLLAGMPQVTQITIRRPTLRVTQRPDGTWSAAKLLPLPKFSEHPPKVVIENGSVEIFDPLKSPASTLTLRQFSGTVEPPDLASPTPQAREFRGTFSADHLRGVEVEGLLNPDTLAWTIGGAIEGLDISPEFRDALPGPLPSKLTVLQGLRGQGTLSFRVSCNPAAQRPSLPAAQRPSLPAAPSPYRFNLSGQIVRGRLDDPRLPHPLTDVQAKFRVSNDGFAVDELFAHSGRAVVRNLSARQAGFELGKSPLWIEAEIRQMELDQQLFERLPEPLKDQWRKYRPEGRVNATVKFHFDGQTWHPDLSVECLNVALTYYKFPYRLEHGTGWLTWKETPNGELLKANLTAYSGNQAVRMEAKVLNPNSGPSGWFEATGEGLRLDKKLLDALNDKSRAFVSSLNPSGTVNARRVRIWRDVPGGPLHRHFVIDLNGCSMRYKEFPYPLNNICGTLVMHDDEWTFPGLVGTNDTGRVVCEEGWLKPPQQGRELYLRLVGTDVPLEEELRNALRGDVQRAWNNLRPRGTVDLVSDVHYLPEQKKLSVLVTAFPQPDSTSIEPVHFPYRLDRLEGVLIYKDGHVTLEGFKAEHGPVKVAAAGGGCDFLPDGSWSFLLKGLTVDGLRLNDRDLIRALPGRLKEAIVELKPAGPINLQGDLALAGVGGVAHTLRSGWDLTVIFHPGASIDCGVKLENLNGRMKLDGAFDGRHFYSRGELDIDSLTYKDLQFTQVMGPLWIDDRQVLLGSWVDRRRNEGSPAAVSGRKPRRLTARLFGGTVYGDGWIMLGSDPHYGLQATLSQADLSRLAQEVIAGRQKLRGKITGSVSLRGAGRKLNGLGGQGTIQLREGDVYQLPLMVDLLKLLSIQLPDKTAFSTSDIKFSIRGGHIYFDDINFRGDAISLFGSGEMDFQQSIRLTFHAIVGRGELNIPLVKELFTGASQQIMLIHAGGTLQNPEIRKEPFPVVGQALQRLQEDLQGGATPQSHFPQSRHWMPNVGSRYRR